MNIDRNEKIRQQYDLMPYPHFPATEAGGYGDMGLIRHSFVSAWYAKTQQVCDRQDLRILDVGCGSGVTTLALAIANPNATIIGIDLSNTSLQLASDRLNYHGFSNFELFNLAVEDLPTLIKQADQNFDYINCEDTLYLLDDPVKGLQAMKSVLAPEGILRTNVHSFYQRADFYRAQAFSRLLGFFDRNPTEVEFNHIREIMELLWEGTLLKTETWDVSEKSFAFFLMNYVIQEDRGFTIPEVFQMLRSASLGFIGIINPMDWRIESLFPNGISEFFAKFLDNSTNEQKLSAYELLHPSNRLLDIWCSHSGRTTYIELSNWTELMWQSAKAHLHPVLRTEKYFQMFNQSLKQMCPNPEILKLHGNHLDPLTVNLCLRFMWENPCTVSDLVNYWRSAKIKLEVYRGASTSLFRGRIKASGQMEYTQAFEEIKYLLSELVIYQLVLIENI